jgi:uncharacterized glyoxalase superfamily protein PhnB
MDISSLAPVSSAVCYRDPKRMYRWLEDAYGLEPLMVILDGEGNLAHSEMVFGGCRIMVGNEWSADHASPASIGGKNTQTVHIQLTDDIDAHCERARRAGAEIMQEPEEQFYGDRTYRARDPEGHIWTFAQTVKVMSPDEWDVKMDWKTSERMPE